MTQSKHAVYLVAATLTLALFCFSPQSGALAAKQDANILESSSAAQSGAAAMLEFTVPSHTAACVGLKECERAARSGDPNAQVQLAEMYLAGDGVEQSAEMAFHWNQLASASGQVTAKVNMGVMYARGLGVKQDESMAVQLFREAAAKGNGGAIAYLGDMYFFGHGVAKDEVEAERWYARGTKMHDPISMYDLGLLNTGEYGHSRDLRKAVSLLKKSAEAGYVPALHSLGLLYVRMPQLGEGSEAVRMLQVASSSGHWRSSVVLGLLHRDGKFVQADAGRAYYYFRLAALQGGDAATNLLANDMKVLERKISTEQAIAISADATAWHQQHPFQSTFAGHPPASSVIYSPSVLAKGSDQPHAGLPAKFPPA